MNIGRRLFVNAALIGAGSALLPVRHLWADSAGSDAVPTEIAARTGSGKPISLTASDIKDFDASLRGELPQIPLETFGWGFVAGHHASAVQTRYMANGSRNPPRAGDHVIFGEND